MRVVLKPGGVVLLLLAIATLTYFAIAGVGGEGKAEQNPAPPGAKNGFSFGGTVIVATPSSSPSSNPSPAPEETSNTPIVPTSNLLKNSDFEGAFVTAIPDMEKPIGHISGNFASGWADSSGWADVSVNYERDETNPHSGKASQKITVTDVKTGQAQIVQYVGSFPGKQLRCSVWVRADKPTSAQFMFRDGADYKTSYATKEFTISTEWQKIEVTGTVTKPNSVTLLLAITQPGTIWVDDASLEVVP